MLVSGRGRKHIVRSGLNFQCMILHLFSIGQCDLNQLREITHLLNAYSPLKHEGPSPTLAHGDLTPPTNSEMKIHPAECN